MYIFEDDIVVHGETEDGLELATEELIRNAETIGYLI